MQELISSRRSHSLSNNAHRLLTTYSTSGGRSTELRLRRPHTRSSVGLGSQRVAPSSSSHALRIIGFSSNCAKSPAPKRGRVRDDQRIRQRAPDRDQNGPLSSSNAAFHPGMKIRFIFLVPARGVSLFDRGVVTANIASWGAHCSQQRGQQRVASGEKGGGILHRPHPPGRPPATRAQSSSIPDGSPLRFALSTGNERRLSASN